MNKEERYGKFRGTLYNFLMVTTPIDTAPYSEAARRMLRPEDCALAVIDIQEKLLPPMFEKERLVRNAQLLVRLADILSLPIMVSTQYEKGLGKTVDEISSLLPDMKPVDKLEFGCFGNGEYCSAGRESGKPHHVAVVRNGVAHLRDANRAWGLKPGLERSCRRRRREFPHRTQLETRPEPHAGRRRGVVVDRNDDL